MHFATLCSLLLLAIPLPLALAHPFKDNGLDGRDSPSTPDLKGVTNLVSSIVSHDSTPAAGAPSNQRGYPSNDKLLGRDDADPTISKRFPGVAEDTIGDTHKDLDNTIHIVRDNAPDSPAAPPIKPDDVKNTVTQAATNVTNAIKDHLPDALPKPSAAPPATKRDLESATKPVLQGFKYAQNHYMRDETSDAGYINDFIAPALAPQSSY